MKITSTILFFLLVVLIIPFKTFAGFPIGKYRDVVVPSFSYYSQTDRFDNNGNIIKGVPGTGFTSYSANLYIGYGISRRLDFIANIPYLYQVNRLGAGNTLINQGAGDLLAGLSYNLVNFNYIRFLSVQVSGIVPLYNTTNGTSALGLGDYGTEVKLMFCGNLPKAVFDKGYFNTEIAYRRYFDTQGPDQISFLGTIGYPVSRHNQISLDLLLMRSFSSDKAFNSNLFAERDYAFFKPQLNFGHQFSRRFSLFLGGFYVPFGLNTGVGYGGSMVAVFKL
jgi:hypothetical protein